MKKHIFLIVVFLCCSGLLMAQTPNTTVITNVSAQEFNKLIKEEQDAAIIDLRTDREIENGFIPGANQIDYLGKTFDNQIAALDKDKTYYIYCQSGGRSSDAAVYMEKQGFKKIIHLEKGFPEWKSKALPIDKK